MGGSDDLILTSPDGIVWDQISGLNQASLNAIAFGDGSYVTVGNYGTMYISTDALSWIQVDIDADTLYDVAYGNNRFVVIGYRDSCISIDNGFTWDCQNRDKLFHGIAYGNGFYIVVGNAGVLLKSYNDENLPICPTAPELYINKSAVSTTSSIVSVHLFAPAGMAVSAYYISETAATPAANELGWKSVIGPWDWMSPCFATETYFNLSEGTDTKTIYVWFKNAAAVVSEKASASITLLP